MSATMPKICRHPDGTDNCDCGGLTGEVCRWVKIIADEQADWDRREKVEYLTAERIRLKRRIGELEDRLEVSAHPAPIAVLEPVARRWPSGHFTPPHITSREAEPLFTCAQLEAHAAEQVRAERERIAAWHDEQANKCINERLSIFEAVHRRSAAAIRARGQV